MPEFVEWPKIHRLFREVVITEKIDGTNAAIGISDDLSEVRAQSRKKLITPGKSTDNYGFAAWVYANKDALVDALGPGLHFGEWCGKGVQQGYGMDEKVFALFNAQRWTGAYLPPGVTHVPILYEGIFSQEIIQALIENLKDGGSVFAPGQKAEGVVIYHKAANVAFKVLCEHDEVPKSVVAEAIAATAQALLSTESENLALALERPLTLAA